MPLHAVSLQTAANNLLTWASTHSHTPHATRRAIRIAPHSPLHFLQNHPTSQKLYFRSRDRSREVAAAAFVHRASGPLYTSAAHAHLRSLLCPNDSSQRFYGATRFDQSGACSSEWAIYEGYTFVLPALELVREGDTHYLAANFYAPGRSVLRAALLALIESPPGPAPSPPVPLLARATHGEDLTTFSAWDAAMSRILKDLSSKQYDKIVIARRKRFRFHRLATPSPTQLLAALDEQNARTPSGANSASDEAMEDGEACKVWASGDPGAYLFCLQLARDQAFVGCTPERLFRLDGRTILAEALAGTVRTSTDGNESEVLSELLGVKNMEEHRFVVDYIDEALARCGVCAEKSGPHVRRLPRLMHLATHIRAQFPPCIEADIGGESGQEGKGESQEAVESDVFRLLTAMHPTPAVCGMPRERTISELATLEDFDRGLFAGPLGWFSREEGEFCVAIRSALVQGDTITAYAGSGIVSASESKSEWDETELKMSAFTDLLLRGQKKSISINCACSDLAASPYQADRLLQSKRTSCKSQELEDVLQNYDPTEAATAISAGSVVSGSEGSTAANSYVLSRGESSNSISSLITVSQGFSRANSGFFDSSQLHMLPNLNTLWGCCCVEELCRNGVDTFFVAPGSRSAPLAVGVVRSRHARFFVTHDERGAGYLAVGYARATGRAAAVVTSSGTAVANLMPAVVEAHMDSLPLILLTADRPPELRDVGANQAISQVGIFGVYVQWTRDMPCPTESVPLGNLLGDVDYAVYMSGSTASGCSGLDHQRGRGPVHLNFMFREMLAPDEQPWDRKYVGEVSAKWKMSMSPLTSYLSARGLHQASTAGVSGLRATSISLSDVLLHLEASDCGLILVGGGSGAVRNEDEGLAIYEIAEALDWPIISDICGGLRFDKPRGGHLIQYADQMLTSPNAADFFKPNAILQFGERITSKRIANLIQSRCRSSSREENFLHVVVSNSTKRADPSITVTHRVNGSIFHVLNELRQDSLTNHSIEDSRHDERHENDGAVSARRKILGDLECLSDAIDKILQIKIEETVTECLTEPWCARTISEMVSSPGALFVGNSMPVRDLDSYGRGSTSGAGPRVAANRGASGIDGIISSGIGYGVGNNQDVTIVLGDMSLIHDLNALHLLREGESSLPIKVTIVVVNNGGGGIFSVLPVAKHHDVFSPVFDTPHSVQFKGACEMFGLEHVVVSTTGELRCALGLHNGGKHRVVEAFVSTNHARTAELRRQLTEMIAGHVDAALEERNYRRSREYR